MAGKFSLEAKFFGFDGTTKIRLYANQGKNGYNLGTTIKLLGQRATTGMQVTVQTEEEARKLFADRVEDTIAKGYKPRGSGTGMIGRRSTFASLPTEPEWGKMPDLDAKTSRSETPALAPSASSENEPESHPEIPTEVPPTLLNPSNLEEVESMVTSEGRGSKSTRRK